MVFRGMSFFLYDGGGYLCCRIVCHLSNNVTTGTRLLSIANEGFGIDPAVELGEVALLFLQILRSLQYRYHAAQFICRYRQLLKLRFV